MTFIPKSGYEPDPSNTEMPVFGNPYQRVKRKVSDTDPHLTDKARVARCNNCGKLSESTGTSGKLTFTPYMCGYWRACPECLAARALEHAKLAVYALESYKTLKFVVFPENCEKTLNEIRDRIGSASYLRMPQHDGMVTLMLTGSEKLTEDERKLATSITEVTNLEQLDALPWQIMINTPWRKALSGTLGKAEQHASTTTVSADICEVIANNANKETRITAWEAAVRETPEVPQALSDIPTLMNKRTRAYYGQLVMVHKTECTLVYRTRGLDIIRIDQASNEVLPITWYTLSENDKPKPWQMVENYTRWSKTFDKTVDPDII